MAKTTNTVKNTAKNPTDVTLVNGTYRISCGSETVDGKRKPKFIYLGKDERLAKIQAPIYRHWWNTCQNQQSYGEAIWTTQYWDMAEGIATMAVNQTIRAIANYSAVEASTPIPNAINIPAIEPQTQTQTQPQTLPRSLSDGGLFKSIEKYQEKLNNETKTGERSVANSQRICSSLKVLKMFLTDEPLTKSPKAQKPDRNLSTIGYEQLEALTTNLKNRKVSGYKPDTIQTMLAQIKCFFEWAEDSNLWKSNCNYAKLFRVKKIKLLTAVERKQKENGIELLTLDELKTLYPASIYFPRVRLAFLLSMNCICTQQQIADFMIDDFHLDAETPYVEFTRGKTILANNGQGIKVRFNLWKETLTAVKEFIQTPNERKNPQRLAFLSEDGFPLVRYNAGNGSKVDSVRLGWERLLKASKIEGKPFKFIRKTISSMVRRLAGEATQQQGLAHANGTVAAKHYTGELDAETEALISTGRYAELNKAMFQIHNTLLAELWIAPIPKRD